MLKKEKREKETRRKPERGGLVQKVNMVKNGPLLGQYPFTFLGLKQP
jgi:hypothetical protein